MAPSDTSTASDTAAPTETSDLQAAAVLTPDLELLFGRSCVVLPPVPPAPVQPAIDVAEDSEPAPPTYASMSGVLSGSQSS